MAAFSGLQEIHDSPPSGDVHSIVLVHLAGMPDSEMSKRVHTTVI